MAHSLIIKFREIREMQNNQTIINRQTVEFHSLKELAKRFALSFGLDALKNREAVTSLHQEGLFTFNRYLFHEIIFMMKIVINNDFTKRNR